MAVSFETANPFNTKQLKYSMRLSKIERKGGSRLHLTLLNTLFLAWPSDHELEPKEGNVAFTYTNDVYTVVII